MPTRSRRLNDPTRIATLAAPSNCIGRKEGPRPPKFSSVLDRIPRVFNGSLIATLPSLPPAHVSRLVLAASLVVNLRYRHRRRTQPSVGRRLLAAYRARRREMVEAYGDRCREHGVWTPRMIPFTVPSL